MRFGSIPSAGKQDESESRIHGETNTRRKWAVGVFILLAWEYAREKKRTDMFDDRWKNRRMASFMIYIIPTPVFAVGWLVK